MPRLKCFIRTLRNIYMNIRYCTNSYRFSLHTLTGSSNSVRYSLVDKDLSESPDMKESAQSFLYGIAADNHKYLYGVHETFKQKNTPVL